MQSFQVILRGILTILLLVPLAARAGVQINEIAWMGTENSANDEWLELFNNGGESVDLTGWTLVAADGTPSINFSLTIPAGSFLLLERTDDTSVPGVTADIIYTGAMENVGEILVLKDASGTEVYRVDASAGWPAGDNNIKETAQLSGGAWVTAAATPRAANPAPPPPPPPPPPPSEPEPEPELEPELTPPPPPPEPVTPETASPSSQQTTHSAPSDWYAPAPSPVPTTTVSLPSPAPIPKPVTSVVQQNPPTKVVMAPVEPVENVVAASITEESKQIDVVAWISIVAGFSIAAGVGTTWYVRKRRHTYPQN